MFLLTIETLNAAELQGDIYDIGLDKVKNAIVEINTVPLQRVVAAQGAYDFKSISPGVYNVKAYTSDKKLATNETIIIKEEGTYTFDLFLIPELESEETPIGWSYFLVPLIIIVGIILFLKYKKRPKKAELDKDLDYIADIIKKEGSRMVQKDIVQKTGLSEAKISLMITDLESKGIIRKIKKGRANIIILNK